MKKGTKITRIDAFNRVAEAASIHLDVADPSSVMDCNSLKTKIRNIKKAIDSLSLVKPQIHGIAICSKLKGIGSFGFSINFQGANCTVSINSNHFYSLNKVIKGIKVPVDEALTAPALYARQDKIFFSAFWPALIGAQTALYIALDETQARLDFLNEEVVVD